MAKKNIRTIPASVERKLGALTDQYVVAGCARRYSANQIRDGVLSHLGIRLSPEGLDFPQTIVPPEEQGKFSNRNVNGQEIVRRDLEKETHYTVIDSPNWGDYSLGTHDVSLPYEKYPRDFRAPAYSAIKIQCPPAGPGQDIFVFAFEVDRVLDREDPNFRSDLLICLNLLQENVGACGVQRAGATLAEHLGSLVVSWEILPPGTRDEVLARLFRGRSPSAEERGAVEERYGFFQDLKPKQLVYGTSGLQRYFGAQLEDDLIVFENIEYGNAIYIMFEDWQNLSQKSRTELLSGRFGDGFERVLHTTGWQDRVRDIVLGRRGVQR